MQQQKGKEGWWGKERNFLEFSRHPPDDDPEFHCQVLPHSLRHRLSSSPADYEDMSHKLRIPAWYIVKIIQ
jgi:hypothetical protein